jgi:hypothetical protein
MFRCEQRVQVCSSTWTGHAGGRAADADTLVILLIPAEKLDQIEEAVARSPDSEEITCRIFWTTNTEAANTLIIFAGEFKNVSGNRNKNQLLINFRAAQSQRLALGLPDTIIWGATCAMGQFTVYSSVWNSEHDVSHFISNALMWMLKYSIRPFFGRCIGLGT